MPNIEMSSDFLSSHHDALLAVADVLENAYRGKHNGAANPNWMGFALAMNGITYRWKALAEADSIFQETVSLGTPTMEERYREESALFAFFTTALSVYELTYFAMYCFAAQVKRPSFPLLATKPRQITPKSVIEAFQAAYPSELMTQELERVASTAQYEKIKDLRDVLSHRGSPPRTFAYAAPSLPGQSTATPSATWEGILVDANLTPSFRATVSADLNRLLEVGLAFATQQIASLIP